MAQTSAIFPCLAQGSKSDGTVHCPSNGHKVAPPFWDGARQAAQKTKRTFLTMISRRELSNILPRSMMEVTNVLKGISGRATLASVAKLECTLAQKDDQEGDAVANKDWGISVAEEDGTDGQ
jgi:hypothetical protein